MSIKSLFLTSFGSIFNRFPGSWKNVRSYSCLLAPASLCRRRPGVLSSTMQLPPHRHALLACTNPTFSQSCGMKTKKAAAKRFRRTGKNKIKAGHCGKGHNTSKKSKDVMRRLNCKSVLVGTNLKNMRRLLAR